MQWNTLLEEIVSHKDFVSNLGIISILFFFFRLCAYPTPTSGETIKKRLLIQVVMSCFFTCLFRVWTLNLPPCPCLCGPPLPCMGALSWDPTPCLGLKKDKKKARQSLIFHLDFAHATTLALWSKIISSKSKMASCNRSDQTWSISNPLMGGWALGSSHRMQSIRQAKWKIHTSWSQSIRVKNSTQSNLSTPVQLPQDNQGWDPTHVHSDPLSHLSYISSGAHNQVHEPTMGSMFLFACHDVSFSPCWVICKPNLSIDFSTLLCELRIQRVLCLLAKSNLQLKS